LQLADHIMHDVLQYKKLCARWVPRQLTSELREKNVNACKEHLGYCQTEGDVCLQCIVSGGESWADYFQPETRRATWQHPTSPKPKKFCAQPSAGRVMLPLFWDSRGPILEHYIIR